MAEHVLAQARQLSSGTMAALLRNAGLASKVDVAHCAVIDAAQHAFAAFIRSKPDEPFETWCDAWQAFRSVADWDAVFAAGAEPPSGVV
ncbi:MAG: hypothetical protein HQL38_10835 [Alphaproteobacteria bacterium]|nr:hypothetical protein [Alphaproteobacteria bacterium]